MKYFKFVIKCIFAAMPIIAIVVYTLMCPFCYMDEEYPSWRYTKDVASGKLYNGEYFETVILGDSGAMSALVPELLSDSCINLSVGGGTSIEMYYFLKEYLENHPAPKVVVMMFAPFHYFTIDNYENRTMYFKAIDVKDLPELYGYAKDCGAKSVYDEGTIMNDLSCRLGLPTKYLPAITASRFINRRSNNIEAYERLVANRGYGTFGTADGCYDASYECSYDVMPFNEELFLINDYMQKIDKLCAEYGISGIILQPALNEATYEQINPTYKEMYEAYLEDALTPLFSNFIMETKLRCYDNAYFGDVSHLNETGAREFSNEIKETYPMIFGADS